jgi:hypothetical protein
MGLCCRCLRYLLAAGVVFLPAAPRAQSAAVPTNQPMAAPADVATAMVQYRRALEEYSRAHQIYAEAASAYWTSIAEKRKLRNTKRARNEALAIEDYVLDQPPVYTGPPKPRNPLKPEAPPRPVYVPVVADFLTAALQ